MYRLTTCFWVSVCTASPQGLSAAPKKYKMDITVGDIVVELKSVVQLLPAHRAQLCNYLRLTHKPIGVLINFGGKDLIGERWAFDKETNECFLIDRHMNRVYCENYNKLLLHDCIDTDDE